MAAPVQQRVQANLAEIERMRANLDMLERANRAVAAADAVERARQGAFDYHDEPEGALNPIDAFLIVSVVPVEPPPGSIQTTVASTSQRVQDCSAATVNCIRNQFN